MLRIFHAGAPQPHLKVIAPVAKLEAIRRKVLEIAEGQRIEFSVLSEVRYTVLPDGRTKPNFYVPPDCRVLDRLTVRAGDGPCYVGLEDNTALVTGGRAELAGFASCFDFYGRQSNAREAKHAYHNGDVEIHPDSLPLAVMIYDGEPNRLAERSERYRRPWYHLHFGPWCLLTLAAALYLYALVGIENLDQSATEYYFSIFLGSGSLLGAAFLEAKYQWEEDAEKIEQERKG